MKLIFVGETWKGSNARSLQEALERSQGVQLRTISVGSNFPSQRKLLERLVRRLMSPLQELALRLTVIRKVKKLQPEFVIFYKGRQFSRSFLIKLKSYTQVVNCFPDYSPHAYGRRLRSAIGTYDLVISTKSYHPDLWSSVYGYTNPCVFVPHSYDPDVHLRDKPPDAFKYDVVFVGTARAEYITLVRALADLLPANNLRVALGGDGWDAVAATLPPSWNVIGPQFGADYVETLRSGKVAISPVQTEVVVNGVRQPGDQDTARTYELAAAWCFFIHKDTPLVRELYDPSTEAPTYNSATDLAEKILLYLERPTLRAEMAKAAHQRAVPRYSADARADSIVAHLKAISSASTGEQLESP